MKSKKIILSLILLVFVGKNTFSQVIPNADFENWTPSLIFTYDPDNWVTDNQEATPATVVPDSLAYSNDLAMRVIAQPDGLGSYGEAYVVVPVFNEYSEQLSFYAKWAKTQSAGVFVEVDFLTGNQELVYMVNWFPNVDSSDWTLVNIDLLTVLPEPPPINEIKIRVVASVGDFAPGEGWISVDAMEFSSATAIDEIEGEFEINIFPNPTRDYIHISSSKNIQNQEYQIMDIQGKVVQRGKISDTITIDTLPSGRYVFQVVGAESVSRSFVLER